MINQGKWQPLLMWLLLFLGVLSWVGIGWPYWGGVLCVSWGLLGPYHNVGLILGSHSFWIPRNGLALGPKLSYNNVSSDVFLRQVSCRCLHVCVSSRNKVWIDTNVCGHVVCTSKPTDYFGCWKLSPSINNCKQQRFMYVKFQHWSWYAKHLEDKVNILFLIIRLHRSHRPFNCVSYLI